MCTNLIPSDYNPYGSEVYLQEFTAMMVGLEIINKLCTILTSFGFRYALQNTHHIFCSHFIMVLLLSTYS